MATQHTTTVIKQSSRPPYDRDTALWLSIGGACLFGVHGVHRCYTGDAGLGVCQCLTCGGCWIWSIIEWISIEQIVDDANRRRGWTGTTVATTTTVVSTTQPSAPPPQPQYVASPQPQYAQQPPPYNPQGQPVYYAQGQPQPGQPVYYAQPGQPYPQGQPQPYAQPYPQQQPPQQYPPPAY
mmetsp:Transcript_26281/g.37009  ORF Transcript_26281/g.37009 Transcript_26281/m.37009 type:complete len:181 (-) Transcript_26281:80-622(-)|eukprot:CAMPEP_0168562166 /NCGR_PEP_ID=MMETSP0413-20121227/11978_1 /TAXON_ID=136452 /ORGANISM="Filamoeba nolandi, Strain NC-AS-23-1" /LENGTH=180 /DNA_ID=CAMNT_0008593575 /DNA_START=53 /DNA_END=595 /DNA_ORIENTATION=-